MYVCNCHVCGGEVGKGRQGNGMYVCGGRGGLIKWKGMYVYEGRGG